MSRPCPISRDTAVGSRFFSGKTLEFGFRKDFSLSLEVRVMSRHSALGWHFAILPLLFSGFQRMEVERDAWRCDARGLSHQTS